MPRAGQSAPAATCGGAAKPRQRTSEANWRLPLKWDVEAKRTGIRPRVFCASLADVFDNEVPVGAGTVERGSDRQSYVTIQGEDLGVARGCVARAEEPAGAADVFAPAGGALGARQSSGPAAPPPAPAMTPGSSEQPW